MKNKFRLFIVCFCIAVIIISFSIFKEVFPNFGIPKLRLSFVTTTSESENGSPYKYYYENLNNAEKRAYNQILDEIYDMPEKIEICYLEGEELDNVFSALLFDNPDLFFVGRKCSITTELINSYFTPEYIMTKEEYASAKTELENKVQSVISSLSDKSDVWQSEYEIHNYIIDNCSYKIESNQHIYSSSYGCLVNGEAACEGYSKAAKLLFDELNIDSALVSGTTTTAGRSPGIHMWNVIKINGNWYNLDITWDDPVNNSGKNLRLYTYFNVSNAEINYDHTPESMDFDCNSMDENYYTKKNLVFSTYTRDNEYKLVEMLADAIRNGKGQVQFRFADSSSFESAKRDLINNNRLSVIMKEAYEECGKSYSLSSFSYSENSSLYVLTIMLS